MRICSLLPSATETLFAMGLGDQVIGVTDICDYPTEVKGKRVICHSLIDPANLSSVEVEEMMQEILRSGKSPFVLDIDWLREKKPDLIIAQDLCYVCSPDASEVVNVCDISGITSKMLVLSPKTLTDIFESIKKIGHATGAEVQANNLVRELQHRVRVVQEKAARASYKPNVFSLEGVNPLVAGGHWLPEMRLFAGGKDVLFAPGCKAQRISWNMIRKASPDVIVIALCSSSISRSIREARWLTQQEGWKDLPAVRNDQVYVTDHVYFSRPGPRIVTGLEILAQILHPEIFAAMIPPDTVVKLPRHLLHN